MAEFQAIRSIAEFKVLDEGDVLEGYLDGFHGGDPPTSAHSRSYWHGWRNAKIESGELEPDEAYIALAEEFVVSRRIVN